MKKKLNILYQTTILQGRLSFKIITVMDRFAPLMLEETDVRQIASDANDRKKTMNPSNLIYRSINSSCIDLIN